MSKNDQIMLDDEIVDAEGYILDGIYISRYFDLQSPSRMSYSTRCAGFSHQVSAKFRYCELGCGNGLTLNILAMLYPEAEFVGVDINPDHIDNANELAATCGLTNIEYIRSDFAQAIELITGKFDYITAHGVYSWVNEDVQNQIMAFFERFIAPDGMAYISYNAMPGWSVREPVWRMVNKVVQSVEGSSVDKTFEGLKFVNFLNESGAPFFAQNPEAGSHLSFLNDEDLDYVSHEYCNEHLKPCYASDVFAHARKFGLNYLNQAESCYNLALERVPEKYSDFIAQTENLAEKEVWCSLIRNDSFRTDVYSSIIPQELELEENLIWDMVFTSLIPTNEIPEEFTCGSRVFLKSDVLNTALIEASEKADMTLRELCAHKSLRRFSPKIIFERAQLLELASFFGFLSGKADEVKLSKSQKLSYANAEIEALIGCFIERHNKIFVPVPLLGTALALGSLEALALHALVGHSLDDAQKYLLNQLNGDYAALLNIKIDEAWCASYLAYFMDEWMPVFAKVGTIR